MLKRFPATSFLPSAELATDSQDHPPRAPVAVHVAPEQGEVKIPPGAAPAAILVPSAEHATQDQGSLGTLFDIHVVPEFVLVQIHPLPTTTSLVPSAEEATDCHAAVGALVGVQVVPESVEHVDRPAADDGYPAAAVGRARDRPPVPRW